MIPPFLAEWKNRGVTCLRATAALILCLLVGCSTTGQVHRDKLGELVPGMTYEEIISTLGEPESSQLTGNDWELTYYFHDTLRQDWVPYALVLDKSTRRLKSWQVHQERQRQDELKAAEWIEALGLSKPQSDSSEKPAASPAGQAAPVTGDISGYYWGYSGGGTAAGSGGTEFQLMLCPNRSFRIVSRSSYSGTEGGSDPSIWYGAEGGDQWNGTWSEQGTNLLFRYSNGSKESVSYNPGERCVSFSNGSTACYKGPADCH